jgi:hypothetical protein
MTDSERLSRIKVLMARIQEELFALVTDDDTYWRLQESVIQRNHRLLTMRSPFFDMLNEQYVSTTASTIRRLVEKQNRDKTNVSIRILIEEINQLQNVLQQPLAESQLCDDLAQLTDIENRIKPYVDRVIAHHDRRGLAIGRFETECFGVGRHV